MTKLPNAQNSQSSTPRHWKAHVEVLQQSGLNRAEYCRQHKLSYLSCSDVGNENYLLTRAAKGQPLCRYPSSS